MPNQKIIELTGPQSEIFHSESAINLFLAGIGSGKTNLAGIISYRYISEFPKAKGFIAANTNNQLNTSTMTRIFDVWSKDYGLKKGIDYVINRQPPAAFKKFHEFVDYYGIISFKNGHVIFIGSLENAKAHEGKEFDYAMLDETKDSKEEDVKEIIIGRLRGKAVDKNQLYIFTSPAKVQWINEWFDLSNHKQAILDVIFEKDDYFCTTTKQDKTIVISSTYHNAKNLPDDYIDFILANNTTERGKALIYGNPFFTTGGEYYSSFSQIDHVGLAEYDPSLPLHISFDQNVVPYTPAGIFQYDTSGDSPLIKMIDEIAMYHPHNTTEHVCRAILRKYKDHKQATFIYGDATGQARKGLTANIKNHYDVIKKVLRPMLHNLSMRVGKYNEWNSKRREYMNMLFEGKLSFDFIINDTCKLTKDDFMYIVQDANGMKKNEKNKDGSEKYGHFSDLTEYFIIKISYNEFKTLNK